jgi:hypothetical protein
MSSSYIRLVVNYNTGAKITVFMAVLDFIAIIIMIAERN